MRAITAYLSTKGWLALTLILAGMVPGVLKAQPVQVTPGGMVEFVALTPSGTLTGVCDPPGCNPALGDYLSLDLLALPEPGFEFVEWLNSNMSPVSTSPQLTGVPPSATRIAIFAATEEEEDSDGDGVPDPLDFCPSTPPNESVDEIGCSASALDDDRDDVSNLDDQCPGTPAGERVDPAGCSASQLDDDNDGVSNADDQCPETPAGASVDSVGCSTSPPEDGDDDNDGVSNTDDQCPETPAGESVDSVGCSDSQRDDDNDGVTNTDDQCPETPAGESVDSVGCSDSQRDDDNDGVDNDTDQCPDTPEGQAVNLQGCSELQAFGDDLTTLTGLTAPQRSLAGRIDEICPRLVADDSSGILSADQRRLREACSRLKNGDTTDEQALDALSRILPEEFVSYRDYVVELATIQFRQLDSRRRLLNSGRGEGLSVSGLNLRLGDQQLSGSAIERAVGDLFGMAAGEGDKPFADFGKLGLFIQGDIDFAERDSAPSFSGYKFDIWSITAGADYRFTDTIYAGIASSFGEAEIEYAEERGTTDIDNISLSLYGGWQITDAWYADVLMSYGESDFENVRNIDYRDSGGGYQATHLSETDGEQLYLGLNTGYQWNHKGLRFGPMVSVFYVDGTINGFSERAEAGSDDAWLMDIERLDYKSLRLSAGFQADYALTTGFGVLLPNLRAVYVREAEDGSEDIGLRLLNNPYLESGLSSNQLHMNGREIDNEFFDLGLGISAQLPMGFSGFIDYHFYESFKGFSRDGYSFGLRWDKPF